MPFPIQTRPARTTDILPEEGVEKIHETSLTVLSELGIAVRHEEALALLESNGCSVDHESDLVHFPRSLVEECLDRPPERFTLHARNPANDAEVGGDDYVLAPVYGPPNVRTYEDGRRSSTIDDFELFMKLVQQEDPIGCAGYNVCEPTDVDQAVKHVEMLRRSLKMTDKPVMASAYGEDRARTCLDMVGIAVEDRELRRPYATGVVNTVPPRQWDTKQTGGLMEFARRGQPALITPGVMSSASGPATLAGSLALSNAEALVGVVISQLVNPGAPLVYRIGCIPVDIRTGIFAIGSPEARIATAVATQMARHYGLPVRGHGSLTDAKTINSQSGTESMFSITNTLLNRCNFVLHAAGALDSYTTVSPEKFVLDCERIRMVERYLDGFELTEEALALGLLEDVDPGGHFLDRRHTLTHGQETQFFPNLFDRQSHDAWHDDGEPDPFELAHERVRAHLDDYERPDMAPDVEADLQSYADEARREILGSA